MRKRILIAVGIGVFISLIGVGIFGDHGLLRLYKLRNERKTIEKEIQLIEKENEGLAKRIKMLKTDLKYLEQLARKRLGMIKPDEVIIKLPENGSGNSAPEKSQGH